MVNQVWASGGTVTAVSDGSLVRGRRSGEHFLPVERDRLSCGWVLGHDPEGATGANRAQLLEIGRGGYRIAAEGCVSSSYLTELAGALDVLCTLMAALGEGDRPGAVQHWCDNEGGVTLICARRDVVPRKWRKTPCRHLWAELCRRLNWWEAHGGSWETRWVKGHVDADPKRLPASYTAAERLNIRADKVAEVVRAADGGESPVECRSALKQFGGRAAMIGRSRLAALHSYWSKRQAGRKNRVSTTVNPACTLGVTGYCSPRP